MIENKLFVGLINGFPTRFVKAVGGGYYTIREDEFVSIGKISDLREVDLIPKSDSTSPDPLASIAESLGDLNESLSEALTDIFEQLKPVGKFFRHLNNGEVVLEPENPQLGNAPWAFRITITEGEGKK